MNDEPSLVDEFCRSLTEMARLANENSRAHGFWSWYEAHKNEPESVIIWKLSRIALIHSESSECLEGVRKGLADDHLLNRTMEVAELADTVIRILDYCAGHNLPLAEVILEKMKYNTNRPVMHGDKKA